MSGLPPAWGTGPMAFVPLERATATTPTPLAGVFSATTSSDNWTTPEIVLAANGGTLSAPSVPMAEPTSLALIAFGLAGLPVVRRRPARPVLAAGAAAPGPAALMVGLPET
jgi:hypothetical protein